MDNLNGVRLGFFAALTVLSAWALYWPRIKAHRVPRQPIVYQAAMTAGAILAVLALGSSPGVVGALLAAIALVGAGFFLFSSMTSAMPRKAPAVAVGDRYLDFIAADADGGDFALSSLEGRPFLLKFYRGHW
jgi:hypothetical protein